MLIISNALISMSLLLKKINKNRNINYTKSLKKHETASSALMTKKSFSRQISFVIIECINNGVHDSISISLVFS